MFRKDILESINQMEIDPQDNNLFGNIMQERKKRNATKSILLLSALALMFVTITSVSVGKYWGNMPKGYSQEDIEQIGQKEYGKDNFSQTVAHIDIPNTAQTQDNKANFDVQVNNNITEVNENPTLKETTKNSLNDAPSKVVDVQKSIVSIQKTDDIKGIAKRTLDNSSLTKKDKADFINPSLAKSPNANARIQHAFESINFSIPQLKKLIGIEQLAIKGELLPTNNLANEDTKNTDAKTKQLKYLPREINVFGTFMYNQKFLNGSDKNVVSMFESREKITQTYGYGFTAEFGLPKNMFIQAGITQLSVKQNIADYTKQNINVRVGTIVDPGGVPQQITIRDTTNQYIRGGNSISNFINIPLTIGMRWQKGKHIVQPQFGVITSFYSKSKGVSLNNQGDAQIITKRIERYTTASISTVGGFAYSYVLGKNIAAFINPQLRYSLSSLNKHSSAFSQYNSMIGVQLGVKYIIK